MCVVLWLAPAMGASEPNTRRHFREVMPTTVRADHPAMRPVVEAIRAITSDPLEQLVVVNDVTHLLVEYDDDERVYGALDYHATLDEMIAKRRQEGWIYLRDDCDGRAIFAAHLLAALGIPWRLETSYWKRHAWVVATVGGVEYDLLDLRPEEIRGDLAYRLIGVHFTHASHRPPFFEWRRAWADRTHQDFAIGLQLGLVSIDSTPGHLRLRHSTDWAKASPGGKVSPFDPRTLTASSAGFPYGEPIRAGAIAALPAPVNGLPAILAHAAAGAQAPLSAASTPATASELSPEPTHALR
jgi:hypothetical protein